MGAFVPFHAGLMFPRFLSPVTAATVQICDDQNEGCAVIQRMYVDDTITHVFVASGAKNGTPANDSYTVSVQSVTNGLPSGTILGGGSPASATFPNATYPVASWGTNTGFWIQLANSIALQAGEIYAFVIQKTGTTDAVNYLRFNYSVNSTETARSPYTATCNSASTWAKVTSAPGFIGWKSGTAIYGMPAETVGSLTFGNTVESGGLFTFPSAFGTSNTYGLQAVRVCMAGTAPAASGTMVATLYSGALAASPTALQRTASVDSDDFGGNNTNQIYEFVFPEDTLAALVPGTEYGVGFAHSGATSGSIRTLDLDAAADAAAYPMGGMTYITRTITYPPDTDTNAFTETTTSIVLMELMFREFTAASGGGGQRVIGS